MNRLLTTIVLTVLAITAWAQVADEAAPDTLPIRGGGAPPTAAVHTPAGALAADSMLLFGPADSASLQAQADTAALLKKLKVKTVRTKRDWNTWTPDPQRALWLALVLPGAGQIYNRKYWKLPIFYGGFLGCIYALTWNDMMYKDYSQAYLDIMDDDPGTASFNRFLHLGKTVTQDNEEYYKGIFKNRKDKYRRWRDMSFFVMIGVYALSVIDAYVDAELSVFDISKDLSLKVEPTAIPNRWGDNLLSSQSLGLRCSLTF